MKMSNVFDLPFTADAEFQSIYDASGEPLPDFESVEKDRAVVQAINSHDILVALNKELVEALEHSYGVIVNMMMAHNDNHLEDDKIHLDSLHLSHNLINKAKELLKEHGDD